MSTTSTFSRRRSRALAGAFVASAVLLTTMGLGITVSGATSSTQAAGSAFCTTVESIGQVKAPSSAKLTTYKTWLKRYLPLYEKMASEAPNAKVKKVLNQLVTLMKYESNVTAAVKLDAYIAKNEKEWTADWEAFAKAIISCATSVTLP